MSTINEMLEQRTKLYVDAQAILSNKEKTADQRQSALAMLADADVLDTDITALRKIEAAQADARSFVRSPRGGVGTPVEQSPEERKSAFNGAFRTYARYGLESPRLTSEQRDLLTTSDATGGALIPQEFYGSLVEALKYNGPTAQLVEQKVTDNNGRPMKISYSNDTQNGIYLLGTEGTSSPQETDPVFVSKILGVDTVTGGLVKISFQELEDSAFDLDAFIRKSFSIRFARGIETAVTLGTDTAGVALPNQAVGGLVASAGVGFTTAALANGIGWDDLTGTIAALDPAYSSNNPKWVLHNKTRIYLLGLKDGFGRPFFTPDPATNRPFAQLLGYDIVLNQSMAQYNGTGGANALPILFGDLEKAYMLRTDGAPSILRLNERFADQLEVGFYLYSRIGGISLNAGVAPLVSLKLAAS